MSNLQTKSPTQELAVKLNESVLSVLGAENVDESTDIVCLQDMRSNFNKETLYNAITGNFEIGKKYKAKEVIPFSRSPKLIADSNFGIKLSGNSDLARFVVIGFSHYWSKDNEPMYRYKKRLL